jgi:asparagine synthetase B (glutamine-hydrolysing)
MSELFAVCSRELLSESEIESFEVMKQNLLEFREGSVKEVDLGFCRLGVISRHKLDRATILELEDPKVTMAWVGTPPRRAGLSFAEVAYAIFSGRTALLARLEPRFAAVVCDVRSRSIWCVSDRHGLLPLHVAHSPMRLACSTKMLPLIVSGLVGDRLDAAAILDFFTFEHVLGDRTFLEEVRVLPQASVLRMGAPPKNYWQHPLTSPQMSGERPPTRGELYSRLRAGLGAQNEPGNRVAIALSGGLDSRALLSAARDSALLPDSYTFGITGCSDMLYAYELANILGLKHRVVPLDGAFFPRWLEHAVYTTGGMVAAIHFHVLSLADDLAENADVVFDGLGGDALSGAHLNCRMLLTMDPRAVADRLFRYRATAFATIEDRRRLFHPDFLRTTEYDPRQSLNAHFRDLSARNAWRGCHRFDLFERQRRFIQYGPQLLQPLVQVETPFYANAFFDAALRLGLAQLLEQRAYLAMQREHLGPLALIPDTRRRIPLARSNMARLFKGGFDFSVKRLPLQLRRRLQHSIPPTTDYASWFSRGLSPFVAQCMRDGLSGSSNLFNPTIFATENASTMRALSLNQIGCLLAFSVWQTMVQKARSAAADVRQARHEPGVNRYDRPVGHVVNISS